MCGLLITLPDDGKHEIDGNMTSKSVCILIGTFQQEDDPYRTDMC